MRYDHFSMLPEQAFSPIGKRMTLEGGGGGGWVAPVLAVAAVVVVVVAPYVAPAIGAAMMGETAAAAAIIEAGSVAAATTAATAAGDAALAATLTSIGTTATTVGAATMGAATGAVAGSQTGGDAVWRGAVTGAVGGAVGGNVAGAVGESVGGTVGEALGDTAGKIATGAIGGAAGGAAQGAASGATGAALTDKSIGETALTSGEKGAVTGAITGGLGVAGRELGQAVGEYFSPEVPGGYETAEGAFDASGKQVATWNPETGQYETPSGEAYLGTSYPNYAGLGEAVGGLLGRTAGDIGSQYAKSELFPTQTTQYSGGTATGSVGDTGAGGKTDQVLYPQFGTGSSALAQALRTASPAAAIGGGGVEPSGGEGEQQSVWNISSLKLKDALGA